MASAHEYEWTLADGSVRSAWRAKWTGADGKAAYKRGFTRERDALGYAGDREAEIRHGVTLGQAAPTGKTTLGDWSRSWLAGLDVRASTRDAYEDTLKRLGPLEGRTLSGLRPSEVKAWRRGLTVARGPRAGQPLAASTSAQTAAVLAMVLRAAVDDGLITKSPMAGSRRQHSQAPIRLVDPAEILTLEQVRGWGSALPPVACEMPLIAAMTGLRQGELLGLQLPNVDFLRRTVRVAPDVGQLKTPRGAGTPFYGPPKTPAGARVVPLPTAAAEALARHLERFPPVEGEPVFRGARGQRWRRGTFGDVWRQGQRQAGLPGWVHWHALRDVFASSLIYTGQDSKVITTLMGHSSAAELRPYERLWPNSQDRARQALDALWSGTSEGHGGATGGVTGR